jgi:DNA-binding CsgD family transcriptional regulator
MGGWCCLVLRGRGTECERLDELLDAVRGGESRALVVRGEPGVGKTALLDYLVGRSRGFRVSRIAGVQSEMELAFAGLHQLCAPMTEQISHLPGAQQEALRAALGLGSGNAPDGFLVALATLGLLAEVAGERPLLCVVDDAQWLDRASMQVLAFTARRLEAESVAVIFASRLPVRVHGEVPAAEAEPTGVPELLVGGLPDEEARDLLRSVLPGRWDEQVLDRIVAEARGNPLALLELPRGSTPAEFAGGFGLPDTRALTGRIREAYQRRVARLPLETRRFLLVAAAEASGEPVLLWRAAERMGIAIEAAAPAVSAGLVDIGERVRFYHPLVRSGVYWAASPENRRGTHRVLAEVTDAQTDPDRRAWHAAHGALGPDEDVAVELEGSAERARARGGLAAAAAFLARAVELTPDPARRRERAMAAARATHRAGSPEAALRLLSIAEAGPMDERRRGEIELLRAQIAFAVERGSEAPVMLLKAARQLEPYDVTAARETYLEAISAAMFAGQLAYAGAQLEAAQAARSSPSPSPPSPADLLLDGTAMRITEGHAAAVPLLKRALRAFSGPDLDEEEGLRWLWLAGVTAVGLWDHCTWDLLSKRHLRLARQSGQATMLPLALTARVAVHATKGDLTKAASLVEEVKTVSEAVGTSMPSYGLLLVAAWEGDHTPDSALFKNAAAEAGRRGEGGGVVIADYVRAVLANSLGRYGEALEAAERASLGQPLEIGVGTWGLVEYIEAAARSEERANGAEALRLLSEVTRPSGTDWGLGIEARSRALMSEDDRSAESHYQEGIERLGRVGVRGDLARTHLLYGEWLRRRRHRHAAREQLRIAYESFTTMGMLAFAQRAAHELQATGENARKRTVQTAGELTPQEAHIIRLVREGLTNPEIGARLFISPRTVEWHLRKIFAKLGLTSRRQLQRTTPSL